MYEGAKQRSVSVRMPEGVCMCAFICARICVGECMCVAVKS